MIQESDKIAIGVSGGKDSLALLVLMASLRRFFPIKFDIVAITCLMGLDDPDYSDVRRLCEKLDVEYIIEPTQIAQIVFEERKEANPCSLCANMRRGALHSAAKKYGCNKIAFGHHKDDVLETFLMSTLYEGRIHTFSPVTYLDRTDITLIRPMIYIEEKDIVTFANSYPLTPVHKTCRVDGHTNRENMKSLIKQLQQDKKDVKNTLFGAIQRAHISGWKEGKK